MVEPSPSWVFETGHEPASGLLSRENLERENERLRAVLGYCPKCIAVLDEEGKLVGYNREFASLFRDAPPVGCPLIELLDATEDWLIEHVINAASSGRRAAALVPLRSDDPEERFIEFVVATLPGEDDTPVGVILAGEDRTSVLLDEWDRTTAARTIADLNTNAALELGRSVIQHELTTHIAAASLAIKALENAPPSEHAEWLTRARESLQLATKILGTPVRQSGSTTQELANVRVAAEQATHAVHSKPHRVTVRVECPQGMHVSMSQSELVQVLTNLVSNANHAIHESDKNGSITISADLADDGTARIMVRDNGPGFDPDKFRSVFELGSTSRAERGGQGIGLALVRSIVEGVGGTLHVFTEPGVGSEIGIILPASAQRTAAIA